MHLRYALLALLGEGEAHGYELLKRFNRRIGPFWHPNIGQVYQLLHELERRRLVVRRDEDVGTRTRRVFRLTPRGERALGAWLARRPGWPAPLRDEIFVRLLAAERGGPAAAWRPPCPPGRTLASRPETRSRVVRSRGSGRASGDAPRPGRARPRERAAG